VVTPLKSFMSAMDAFWAAPPISSSGHWLLQP